MAVMTPCGDAVPPTIARRGIDSQREVPSRSLRTWRIPGLRRHCPSLASRVPGRLR